MSQRLAAITTNLKHSLESASREIITPGFLLIQAKSLVGHGHFRNWLAENFSMSAKTANRFMLVAEMVQRHRLDEDTIAKLMRLDFKSLYELAAKSTPASVQTQMLAKLESGQVCYELIREWKQRERRREPTSGRENIGRLAEKLHRFETWFEHNGNLLEEASLQLDEESRQALQEHASQLRGIVTRVEAILAQSRTLQIGTIQETPAGTASSSLPALDYL